MVIRIAWGSFPGHCPIPERDTYAASASQKPSFVVLLHSRFAGVPLWAGIGRAPMLASQQFFLARTSWRQCGMALAGVVV